MSDETKAPTTEPGASPDHPLDNAASWVGQHIKAYEESDGTSWPTQQGRPLMLLTTKGAQSGLWRRTALIYGEHEGRVILVASKGGFPQNPGWYVNLSANPEVVAEVHERRFHAVARTASPEEKPALWALMTSIWPDYDEYQKKTDREIPVVILEPRD